jgi:hypothetical protein
MDVVVQMVGGSAQDAVEVSDMLLELDGVESVQQTDAESTGKVGPVEIGLVVTLIVAAGLAVRFVADAAYKIRQRFRPFLILDFSADTPVVHVLEDVPGMRGEIAVRSRDGEEVKLENALSADDILAGIKQITGGGDS